MKIVNLIQGSQEWHDFRKGGIGSSDISVLMGSNPFGRTAFSLFEDKTTGLIDYSISKATNYGKSEEPKALEYLVQKYGSMESACAIHDNYDFARCSFDALSNDTFYEIKSPISDKVLENALCGDFPRYWIDQIQWQLFISGFEKGHLAVWDGTMAHVFEIAKDPSFIEDALNEAKAFWKRVLSNDKPEPEESDFLNVEDQEAIELMESYKQICQEEKTLAAKKEDLRGRILDVGPGHNFKIGSAKIYQNHRISYDYNRMKQDGIKVENYQKVSKPFWVISIASKEKQSAKL